MGHLAREEQVAGEVSTRAFIGGAVVMEGWGTRTTRPPEPPPVLADGRPAPVAPTPGPALPQEVGLPFEDGELGITFRVVRKLDLREGWGTAGFWMARYRAPWEAVAEWVRRGWLDAAVEAGSPTRRYRLRDEAKVLAWLGVGGGTIPVPRTRRVRR